MTKIYEDKQGEKYGTEVIGETITFFSKDEQVQGCIFGIVVWRTIQNMQCVK